MDAPMDAPQAPPAAAVRPDRALDGLSDEVVGLLAAMKGLDRPQPQQHDDEPGFWSTTESSDEGDDGDSAEDSAGPGTPQGGGAGARHARAPAPPAAERPTGGARPTAEAQLNRRRRIQRMSSAPPATPATATFASAHPQLWLALHAGPDAAGLVAGDREEAAGRWPASAADCSAATAPLGERNAAARSGPPFALECELDLGAVVAPAHWAPAPHGETIARAERVRLDLEPLLRAARRAVQLVLNGAPKSAALTLQTLIDGLFINAERYGPWHPNTTSFRHVFSTRCKLLMHEHVRFVA